MPTLQLVDLQFKDHVEDESILTPILGVWESGYVFRNEHIGSSFTKKCSVTQKYSESVFTPRCAADPLVTHDAP